LANENRQPSTERNGVIERRLTGNQNKTEDNARAETDEKSPKVQKEINKDSTGNIKVHL